MPFHDSQGTSGLSGRFLARVPSAISATKATSLIPLSDTTFSIHQSSQTNLYKRKVMTCHTIRKLASQAISSVSSLSSVPLDSPVSSLQLNMQGLASDPMAIGSFKVNFLVTNSCPNSGDAVTSQRGNRV
jgi:hypothetical protein